MPIESLFHIALAAVALVAFAKLNVVGRKRLFGVIGGIKMAQELYVLAASALLGRSLEHVGETVVWLAIGSVLLAYGLKRQPAQEAAK